MKNIFLVLFAVLFFQKLAVALDSKIKEGSDKVEPNEAAKAFFLKYTEAINSKNLSAFTALFAPNSLKCFKESAHPEYYAEEFKRWSEKEVKGLKEMRKFNSKYDVKFYQLMKYPEAPTHVAEFDVVEKSGGKTFTGWMSIEILEKDGRYYLDYRCM